MDDGPRLIVLVLVLTTVRTIYTVQAPSRPPGASSVRVIGINGGGSSNILTSVSSRRMSYTFR